MMNDDLSLPLSSAKRTILVNVLIPSSDEEGDYSRKDVLLEDGKISAMEEGRCHSFTSSTTMNDSTEIIDCTERMLLPGFVNGHSHSVEHWARGLIQPLPLELWLFQLFRHEPRGDAGWYGKDSFVQTPAYAIYLSALHAGVEAMLSGCTAVMDHLFVRDMADIEAAVRAYKTLGIRGFIAPMLPDDKDFTNYVVMTSDANERNNDMAGGGCPCGGGMGQNGSFRTGRMPHDPKKTKWVLDLWEEAVKKFHDPDGGIEIVVGPVTMYSCSVDLLHGATELRKKYNLCGHTHILETRGQALQAKQFFPSGSAGKHLKETGFLDLRGTSCAHTVWLTEEEYEIMAEAGAVCVHNPLSNLRLGSGIMPLKKAMDANVIVSMGCDGACSSDGQDILEAMKLATTLSTMHTPEYREWLTPQNVALILGAKNGYTGLGMKGCAGEIKVDMAADLTLWDLTALSLLPRTDPLSLLILGSRCQAPGAGSTLDTVWIRGVKTVSKGSPVGIDLIALRQALLEAQKEYRNKAVTDPKTDPVSASAEVEYRAAMGLDSDRESPMTPPDMGIFPGDRVLYDSTIR